LSGEHNFVCALQLLDGIGQEWFNAQAPQGVDYGKHVSGIVFHNGYFHAVILYYILGAKIHKNTETKTYNV
jgi:hypothetical protein